MNFNELFMNENEKPLERWITDGGYCSIFRKIAVIGDSLSSGEFESLDENNQRNYHDMYEYSWGQFIARTCGSTVYNFSQGGMTAEWYLDSFADVRGLWNRDLAAQAYIVALGVNDLFGKKMPVGSVDDIKENWRDNEKTFAGFYGAVIQRYREFRPDAKFFLMTMPNDPGPTTELRQQHADLLYAMAEKFPHTYVLDILKYGPVYDQNFKDKFFMSGHMNPMGYLMTAQMTISYIDYIIRHNTEDFKQIGFIGTPFKNVTVKPNK